MTEKITLVLPITNFEYGKTTYQSLCAQDMSNVKLVLVIDEKEQQLSSDLEELMKTKKLPTVSCVLVDFSKNINQVKSEVEGLVFFLKEGVKYRKDCLLNLKSNLSKIDLSKGGSILLRTLVDKKNPVSMEYDAFMEQKGSRIDLNEAYMLIHRMYFAHGVLSQDLCWEDEAAATFVDDLELSIIRLVTVSVCKSRFIHLAWEAKIWVEGFRDMEKIIVGYTESYEKIRLLIDRLFLPLMASFSKYNLADNKNGQYLKLYYCNRILSAMTQLEKAGVARDSGLENPIVDSLKEMEPLQNEVLCEHPYITTGFKYAYLKYYFEDKLTDCIYAKKMMDPAWRYISLFEMKLQKDNTIYLEFSFMKMDGEDYDLYCVVNGTQYICEKSHFIRENSYLDLRLGSTDIYHVTVPRQDKMDISFMRKETDQTVIPCEIIMFQKTVPFSNKVFLYKQFGKQIFYADDACKTIFARRANTIKKLSLFSKHISSMLTFGKAGVKALAARIICHLWNAVDRRRVWLITDRSNRADDNGEVMFRYLREVGTPNVDCYFVIDKDVDDYARMGQVGKVVSPFGWKHKMLFLRTEVTMSSQANKMVVNPFGILEHLYRDLVFDNRLVFLQHGVTKDNQSKWLNKYNRNLYGFVVNTRAEYDSVLEYEYYYTPERVWLTGMPRFDRLYHDEQKYITIMPTWRKSLSKGTDENGVWLLDDDFKKSEYFIFYNTLLNDERLLAAANKMGYTVCFMPHPNTITGLKYFKQHKDVQFFDMTKSYREVFAQTDLMVTDYSSVAFDFAYLRKPIIYSQFDRAQFFNGAHSYTEGYFDYDRDGFGQVTTDLAMTVDAIILAMENDCKLDDIYRRRIDETFAFDDTDCCKRVLERYLMEREKEV